MKTTGNAVCNTGYIFAPFWSMISAEQTICPLVTVNLPSVPFKTSANKVQKAS